MYETRIAIIGAGASGAPACKACLEQGFDVVVYEKTSQTGGIWRFREEVIEGVGSVSKCTIINSSKEMAAYSNFPPPPHLPNYMHNTKMAEYLESYGKSFDFERYVRFRHEVIEVQPNVDYNETGKWIIRVRDSATGKVMDDIVSGVMVCSGHHGKPYIPKFEDQNKFGGQIMHTHSYRQPDSFANKTVVVVGIGNSGADTAVDLTSKAKKVILSTRRGAWICPLYGPFGRPIDTIGITRFANLLMTYLPFSIVCSAFELFFNFRFNHEEYGLKPKHRALSVHTTANDRLPDCLQTGTVILRPKIMKFTENGVIFEGEAEETVCDVVLLATGYEVSFPFIRQSLVPIDRNCVRLYKNMFGPDLKYPKTLAFVGLIQSQGGAFYTVSEMQSRYFAQLMANKLELPDRHKMYAHIEAEEAFRSKKFHDSRRHDIEIEYFPYMDALASELGVRPNLFKYFFTDFKLWRALLLGPSAAYQFRLKGPHSWPGARNAILTVGERMRAPLRTGSMPWLTERETESQTNYKITWIIFVILVSYLVICFLF